MLMAKRMGQELRLHLFLGFFQIKSKQCSYKNISDLFLNKTNISAFGAEFYSVNYLIHRLFFLKCSLTEKCFRTLKKFILLPVSILAANTVEEHDTILQQVLNRASERHVF